MLERIVRLFRRFAIRLTGSIARREDSTRIREELAEHHALLTDEFVRSGLSPADARRKASLKLGTSDASVESWRDERWLPTLEHMRQDVRYAWRGLIAHRAFALFTMLVMGLGIAATTTMFSVVHAVLIRPLPFKDPGRLVLLEEKFLPRFPRFEASPQDFLDWQRMTRSFAGLAAFRDTFFVITSDDRPERIAGMRVSWSLPAVLGVEPMIGRSFRPEEDRYGSGLVVLLGEHLWRRRFAADPHVVGTSVRLNGLDYTVIGVMPSTFRFPRDAEIWTPMQFTPRDLESRSNHVIWATARLKPGVTPQQAQAEMDLIMPRLQEVWTANVVPLTEHYLGDIRSALYVVFGAAGFVLLIACVNVAGLLVARGSSRQREIAMRAALGASRSRIVQQLLVETIVIASSGGVLGVLVTLAAIGVLRTLPIDGIPRLEDVTVSPAVIAFAVCVSMATGILCGLAPAWRFARTDVADSLKAGGRTNASVPGTRLRSVLVASEVALAVVLLAGAGFFMKSLSRLLDVKTGINAEHVLTATINLPAVNYAESHQQVRFVSSLLERLQQSPEMTSVAITTGLPFDTVEDSGIYFAGNPEGALSGTAANNYRVTPDYFRTLQIPLIRGRLFTDRDVAGGPPVVLINDAIARRYFPGTNPIGRRLDISGPTYLREIVGVVGDVKQEGLRRPVPPQVYEAYVQKPSSSFRVIVRTGGDPERVVEHLRQAVLAVDKGQPLSDIKTMDDIVGITTVRDRLSAMLLGLFAALALMLAAVGIYGVIAYAVAQRTQEIAVRLALGATDRRIVQLVLGQTLRLVFAGLAVGLIASLGLSRVLESLLYETSPRDPVTLLLVSVLLIIVAVGAAMAPAFGALRVHPMEALRGE